jgi:hypothetical protein
MRSKHLEVDDLPAEGDELVVDLELHEHLERCPGCRERARPYLRIATWIARAKTLHRAPPGWHERTLARVLATSSAAQPIAEDSGHEVEDPTTPRVVARVDLHRKSPTASDTTLSASVGARVPVSKAQRRKHWSRVVFPVATAAIMLVIASTLLLSGDEPAPGLAMRSTLPGALPGATPGAIELSGHPLSVPASQATASPAPPAAPANDTQANDTQANDTQANDTQANDTHGTTEPVASKRPGQRSRVAPAGAGIPDSARPRRGGAVTVDWPRDEDPVVPADRAESPREPDILEIARKPRVALRRAPTVPTPGEQARDDEAKLAETMRAHIESLRAPLVECIAAHGNVPHGSKVELVVPPDGRSMKVTITPVQVHSSPLGTCILNVFKKAVFPQSETGYAFRVALTGK